MRTIIRDLVSLAYYFVLTPALAVSDEYLLSAKIKQKKMWFILFEKSKKKHGVDQKAGVWDGGHRSRDGNPFFRGSGVGASKMGGSEAAGLAR
jgi:hypothetical protein